MESKKGTWTVGDLSPPLTIRARKRGTGEIQSLAGCINLKISIRNMKTGAFLFQDRTTGIVILTPQSDGWLEYTWASGDTATKGRYMAYIRYDRASKQETVRSAEFEIVDPWQRPA